MGLQKISQSLVSGMKARDANLLENGRKGNFGRLGALSFKHRRIGTKEGGDLLCYPLMAGSTRYAG